MATKKDKIKDKAVGDGKSGGGENPISDYEAGRQAGMGLVLQLAPDVVLRSKEALPGGKPRYINEASCIHYNGEQHGICGAGHNYYEVMRDKGRPAFLSLPCLAASGLDSCKDLRFPTKKEMQQQDEELTERMKGLYTARQAIVNSLPPWKKGNMRTKDEKGSVDCPICGAKEGLKFTRSAQRGHIWANCVTVGCVSWVE